MINQVTLTRRAQRDLRKLPRYIIEALHAWIENIEIDGLMEVRKISGYHDEPLKGSRKGQRSVRLSQAYRAIYSIEENEEVKIVSVEEVNKHDY